MGKTLHGIFTALVTPFKSDLSVDFTSFSQSIESQIAADIHGLVIGGTTGESATLSDDERREMIVSCIKQVNGRVPIILGIGSNNTQHAVEQTKSAHDLPVTAIMHTVPWYNKPTQEGLYRHFKAISDCTDKDILLYNVPGRTSVDLEVGTISRLARECSNIIGIKDAHVSALRTVDTMVSVSEFRNDFCFMSGEDSEILPVLAAGGDGVISVTSNFAPREMVGLYDLILTTPAVSLTKEYQKITQLIRLMFSHTNPIPVKSALAFKSHKEAHFRLPLCSLNNEQQGALKAALSAQGWL